ncbi:MAG: 16S rRNA (guanine(966)-N(2))-methyltransferase RsmD [Bdellovibrio sp.]|nr:16S rRNA (guanine(966)-N(2))-methyltransferase RsmD [Bdellovibrio sp.]
MIRLTSGNFRGRTLRTVGGQTTRPTQAKLRQALFNSLQMEIPDARVLDLFAGCGALGFEALSRGASQVVFVESSSAAVKVIRENALTLKVIDQIQIIHHPLPEAIDRVFRWAPFDLVLADPPYEESWEERLLNDLPWEKLLSSGNKFCLEWGVQKSKISSLPDETSLLTKVREKEYGDSRLTHFQKK